MKQVFLLLVVLASSTVFAQHRENPNPHPIHQWYGMSAYEFIFSFGDVQNSGQKLDNVLRFTPVFNFQTQRHYHFSNHFGIYTGIGIRNVGFINRFTVLNEEEVTLKQRSYSIGIPLAIKLGGMEDGNYVALGAEAELMFNYKQKILQGENTTKKSEWFSSDVNQFNPSLFADIRFHSGTFFRFRYYLNDFLKDKDLSFYTPSSGTLVSYHPTKSTLWYISIGTSLKFRKKHHLDEKRV